MNKRLCLTCLSVFLVGLAVPFAHADDDVPEGLIPYEKVGQVAPQVAFAKSIEDLPVMHGLAVDQERDILFMARSQRIAQTTMRGPVDVDQVYYFYWRTLKEMGWKDAGRNVYERGDERLTMKVSSANNLGQTIVTFTLDPIAVKR